MANSCASWLAPEGPGDLMVGGPASWLARVFEFQLAGNPGTRSASAAGASPLHVYAAGLPAKLASRRRGEYHAVRAASGLRI